MQGHIGEAAAQTAACLGLSSIASTSMVRVRGIERPGHAGERGLDLAAGIGGIDDVDLVAGMDEGRVLLLHKGVDAQFAIVCHRHDRLRRGLPGLWRSEPGLQGSA